jgi:hypothetical protein
LLSCEAEKGGTQGWYTTSAEHRGNRLFHRVFG